MGQYMNILTEVKTTFWQHVAFYMYTIRFWSNNALALVMTYASYILLQK